MSQTPMQPMAEVFGFQIADQSGEADRHRENRLCPFNNKIPNCTKDKAKDPLGVCSIYHKNDAVITCPIRFREDWIIAADAAKFFFPPKSRWTSLTEVRLNDKDGKSAGNIDVVLVSYDCDGKILDFGALEVQAVYVSGNIRNAFELYASDPRMHANLDWSKEKNFPRPDFLSSSRKRLAPQLLFKGGIFNAWSKKTAVALDVAFFRTLPKLKTVKASDAEIAWLVYELQLDKTANRYRLTPVDEVYTKFSESLTQITVAKPGQVADFMTVLQGKLDEKLESSEPTNFTLEDLT